MTLTHMPASAQDIPNKEERSSDQGITLRLHQCETCGLVQFDCEPVSYYKDVIRSGGFTTTMVNLRKRQYQHFIDTYHMEGKSFLEAGCGQGEFLSVLAEFPVKAYGIEHRERLVLSAREKGLTVWKQFAEKGEKLEAPDGSVKAPYDAFLSFNFLEHQPDPVGMLRCIADNLTEEGMGLITVPSLEYILKYDGYYELIRDHIAYYTFETLRYTVQMAGFEVLEEEMVNRDTLSVIVRKKKADKMIMKPSPVDVTGLIKSQDTIGKEIENLLKELHSNEKKLAIWGASHQGFTLAATTKIGEFAQYIIDSAPFKQGKYAPASHLPIVSPDYYIEHPVDAILIVAPGYTEEITGIIKEKYGKDLQIMVLRSNHLERIER
jgi:2-polyprenyl-3-methyl-5-hydroxy-6-metoxy-1,4-benzoquinol methylase